MAKTSGKAQLERRVEELTHALDLFQQCQEAEYRNLALDVRDELGATLSAILSRVHDIQEMDIPAKAQQELKSVEAMCVDGIEEVRRIARMLRPTVLDAKGLIPALEWFCEASEAQTGMRVVLRHNVPNLSFSKNAELLIYRILREAFNNVYQHTEATLICVEVDYCDGEFSMQVTDNGCGFNVSDATDGVGLVGMRERAAILGGTLDVKSQIGRGTRVWLTCPLEADVQDECAYMEPFFKAGAQILSGAQRKVSIEEALSEREMEVLLHVARGYTSKEIAQMLFLSVRTVETYRMRVMHKIGVKNRSELVDYAMKHGLI